MHPILNNRLALLCLSCVALGLPALAGSAAKPAAKGAASVDGARIAAADSEPQNWLAHGRTYGEQRFSPLRQVNDGNVEKLGLAWSYATGTRRGLQATPIVVDGTMYTTGVWSVVYALDAKTGAELWTFDPQVPRGHWRADERAVMRRARARRDVLAKIPAAHAAALRRDQFALLQLPDHLDHQFQQHLLLGLRETGDDRHEAAGPCLGHALAPGRGLQRDGAAVRGIGVLAQQRLSFQRGDGVAGRGLADADMGGRGGEPCTLWAAGDEAQNVGLGR